MFTENIILKTNYYAIGFISLLATASLAAAPIDSALLLGTWHCSFEVNSKEQTLVGTSVDTYFADGTTRSDSRLSFQLHPFNLDIVYELSVDATWQLIAPDQLVETITAVPKFVHSNPELEAIINLKAELMNGQSESAQIVALSAQRAVFRTNAKEDEQHEISCTR